MPKPIDELLGLGPKREAREHADGWLITVTPPVWSGFDPSHIMLTKDQYERYLLWSGSGFLIQECLPDLTDSQREILISGIGLAQFDSLKEDDE